MTNPTANSSLTKIYGKTSSQIPDVINDAMLD